MHRKLNYETPSAEQLIMDMEKSFLVESDGYNPTNDHGTGAPPQGQYGGSYGQF